MIKLAPARIIISADDPLARAGLSSALGDSDEIEVLAEFPLSGLKAEEIESLRADVFLIDEGWGDDNDRELSRSAHDEIPVLRLVDPVVLGSLSRIPSESIISRETSAESIRTAIQAVRAGWIILDPIISANFAVSGEEELPPLTDREHEVLGLVAEGMTNRAISTELDISENTVKYHVNAIFVKLGAQSRTEAVVLAMRAGLLPL